MLSITRAGDTAGWAALGPNAVAQDGKPLDFWEGLRVPAWWWQCHARVLPPRAPCEEAPQELKGKDSSTLVLLQARLSALTHRQNAKHVPSLMKHF